MVWANEREGGERGKGYGLFHTEIFLTLLGARTGVLRSRRLSPRLGCGQECRLRFLCPHKRFLPRCGRCLVSTDPLPPAAPSSTQPLSIMPRASSQLAPLSTAAPGSSSPYLLGRELSQGSMNPAAAGGALSRTRAYSAADGRQGAEGSGAAGAGAGEETGGGMAEETEATRWYQRLQGTVGSTPHPGPAASSGYGWSASDGWALGVEGSVGSGSAAAASVEGRGGGSSEKGQAGMWNVVVVKVWLGRVCGCVC